MTRFRLPRIARPTDECEHVHALMSDYVDGELATDEQHRVEEHVSFCPRCRTMLANLKLTLGALGSLGKQHAPDEDVATDAALQAWRERAD
jgi:anti-sigma factor RsiW